MSTDTLRRGPGRPAGGKNAHTLLLKSVWLPEMPPAPKGKPGRKIGTRRDAAREASILALYRAGRTQAQVAGELGISKQRVHQILRRLQAGAAERPCAVCRLPFLPSFNNRSRCDWCARHHVTEPMPDTCPADRKTCSQCQEEKPADDFHRDRKGRLGRSCWCKACVGEWQKSHPEVYRRNSAKRYRENREAVRAEKVRWVAKRQAMFAAGELVPAAEKTCPTCGQTKPAAGFYLAAQITDGLSWECRACNSRRSARNAKRRAQEAKEAAPDA